jgi:hypothetical protein
VAADLERRLELADHARHDGSDPERLLDDGLEVFVALALVDLRLKPLELTRMAKQQVERPCERRRRGLVSGDQESDELVTELHVRQRLALLVTRLEQNRENVVALGNVRCGTAARYLVVEDVVHVRAQALKPLPNALSDRLPQRHQHDACERPGLHADVEHPAKPVAQLGEPLGVLDPEYGAHDDLERDRLCPGSQTKRLV